MNHQKAIVIGIAGGSASGKTTVTQSILDQLDRNYVAFFSHDSYYKDLKEFESEDPRLINFDHPSSLDTELLIQHLKQIRKNEVVQRPCYDFKTFRRLKETVAVEPAPIVIVEGILIFSSKPLRDLMDIKIFVDTEDDERLIRRIRRDTLERGRSIEGILDRYNETVKPMHLMFVEPSKRWADVIIPRGGGNVVAIDMVTSKIQKLLENQYEGNRRRRWQVNTAE